MNLNTTNLRDLICIGEIAQAYYEHNYGLPEEKMWMERIAKYQSLLKAELDRLEAYRAFAGTPALTTMDQTKIEELTYRIAELIRDHLKNQPYARDRVFEALNALGSIVALIYRGTGEGVKEAEGFFNKTVQMHLDQKGWNRLKNCT